MIGGYIGMCSGYRGLFEYVRAYADYGGMSGLHRGQNLNSAMNLLQGDYIRTPAG